MTICFLSQWHSRPRFTFPRANAILMVHRTRHTIMFNHAYPLRTHESTKLCAKMRTYIGQCTPREQHRSP